MRDSETLLRSVELLRKSHEYFRWQNPKYGRAALAGWMRYHFRCVYCSKNLTATWESLFGSAHTDHLLPQKYEELLEDDSNLVLGCSVCNTLKHDYDANRELPENLRYVSGPCLTDEQHQTILKLCQQEVAKRRAAKQKFIDEAISNWKALDLTANK